MIEINAPDKYSKDKFTVFLSGYMADGERDWRKEIVKQFTKYDIQFLNPTRHDWDDTWKTDISDPKFNEQVNWELDGIENSDLILVIFGGKTDNPITLLEFGLADKKKTIVYCPQGYTKKGNVDIVCKRYDVQPAKSINDIIVSLKRAYEKATK